MSEQKQISKKIKLSISAEIVSENEVNTTLNCEGDQNICLALSTMFEIFANTLKHSLKALPIIADLVVRAVKESESEND